MDIALSSKKCSLHGPMRSDHGLHLPELWHFKFRRLYTCRPDSNASFCPRSSKFDGRVSCQRTCSPRPFTPFPYPADFAYHRNHPGVRCCASDPCGKSDHLRYFISFDRQSYTFKLRNKPTGHIAKLVGKPTYSRHVGQGQHSKQ